MRSLFFLIIILVLGLFQAAGLNYFRLFSVKPDLLMIMVVLGAVFLSSRQCVCFSMFAGLLKDIFSPGSFGINIILFLIWGLAVSLLARKITIEDNYGLMLVVFNVGLLNSIICRLIFLLSGRGIPQGIFLRIMFIEPLYTSFCLLVIYNVLSYLTPPWRGKDLLVPCQDNKTEDSIPE